MREIIINQNDAGQRVDKFLQKYLPGAPMSLIYKYIRTNKVKLNKKKPGVSQKLSEGDVLRLYILEDFTKKTAFAPAKGGVKVAFEDENFVVLEKEAGVPCQSGNAALGESLAGRLKTYLFQKGEYAPDREHSFAPALCNRLDTNTRGLVIGAKNAGALRQMNAAIREKNVQKTYLCICLGTPPKEEGCLEGYILKDKKNNKSVILKNRQEGAKEVATCYRVLEKGRGASLLEINLITGRSHQIRAHMASVGCPLLGDAKYGGGAGGQWLCAWKLYFNVAAEGVFAQIGQKTICLSGVREEFYAFFHKRFGL